MATYDNTAPQGNDTISGSQPKILGNFQYLPLMLGVDHYFVGTSGSGNDGRHAKLTMPYLASPPYNLNPGGVSSPSGTLAAYPMKVTNAAASNYPTIWVQDDQGHDLPIFGPTTINLGTNLGYVTLYGNIIMAFGKQLGNTTMTNNVSYGFTFSSVPVSVQVTLDSDSGTNTYGLSNVSTTGFTVNSSSNIGNLKYLYWIAIGQ